MHVRVDLCAMLRLRARANSRSSGRSVGEEREIFHRCLSAFFTIVEELNFTTVHRLEAYCQAHTLMSSYTR